MEEEAAEEETPTPTPSPNPSRNGFDKREAPTRLSNVGAALNLWIHKVGSNILQSLTLLSSYVFVIRFSPCKH